MQFFIFLGGFFSLAEANSFLGKYEPHGTQALSAASENALLAELEVALGSGHRHATERRLKRIEQRLSPMFSAMTKNENGKLAASAAGYVLHRAFVQRHGWFIRALEPAGGSFAAWNTSSPTSVLEERLPKHVQSLFEDRLGTHGLGVKELATLAASLEHLVHSEALGRLKVSYLALNFTQDDALSGEEAIQALEMYMSSFIAGSLQKPSSFATSTQVARNVNANILEIYPTWPATQQFLREVYKSVAPKRDYLYFNEMENVIAEIGERYGRFQDIECREMKDLLVASEDPSVGGAGRVRIADFYNKALNEGHWQFTESVDYLRQLGALDESDAANPRVIIPNYISGPSNCLASSAYYSVCCLDECESILGRIEETVSAPEATPSTILQLVASIPSATMPSDRSLSPWLHHRLEEVAKHHGGRVPLHGRLFAQWLHFAYPRECQFPHVSGTIDPQRPEDWQVNTNTSVGARKNDMKRIVAAAPALNPRVPGSEFGAAEESGMWSMHEELVVWSSPAETQVPQGFGYVRGVVMLAAAVSLSVALARNLQPVVGKGKASLDNKYYV